MSIYYVKKKSTILESPMLTRSGYGHLSDDTFHALNSNGRLDLTAIPVAWGGCSPKVAIRDKDNEILKKFPKAPITQTPDIFVSVNLPHLTQPKGKFNINLSCIVEVDTAPDYIIDGLNKYNLSIVTSQFCKDVLLNSKKVTCPIEVVHWGADTTTFKPDAEPQAKVDAEMAKIVEDEAFLFCGQVTHPHLFKDRKDMDTLIKTFCETFKDKPVALVVKTSGTNFSNQDRNIILERIRALKQMANSKVNVYLLHGELNDKEMAALYSHKKVIAHISFSHGESFGMPLLEGSLSGKPTFCPNWSAPKEYITNPLFLFEGDLRIITPDLESEYFPKGSKWFYVDTAKASLKLLDFYNNREKYIQAAKELSVKNAEQFNLDMFNNNINKVIERYIK